jgi:hypothetical protein
MLTKEELRELEGGIVVDGEGTDILNHNTVAYCICNYNNHSNITNKNDVQSCKCACTSPIISSMSDN